ncbi:SIMPL domain-containing protein [Myxococcota bacterium]|nr:SIMPL domain-containing protein [Myxococcota bacterium]MBU1382379.1 SIMPL domain-containing protein [Myxococcota bacterium]MBU1498715.1 SIMPL domain-containing protein [Myxococcota bacterium]
MQKLKNIMSVANYAIIGVAVVFSTWIASSSWKTVKMRPRERTIKVTGSAKKRIVSDLIGWEATIVSKNMDRTAAYRELANGIDKAQKWLKDRKVKPEEISVSSISVEEKFAVEKQTTGDVQTEKNVFKGYIITQSISVVSKEVSQIEKISREITSLLEQGITIQSSSPRYYYTKIGELKIAMLAEASADARIRAENIVAKTDSTALGKLKKAIMGVININPANSTSTSWGGNNDTSSLEKDIITIVHVEYFLK